MPASAKLDHNVVRVNRVDYSRNLHKNKMRLWRTSQEKAMLLPPLEHSSKQWSNHPSGRQPQERRIVSQLNAITPGTCKKHSPGERMGGGPDRQRAGRGESCPQCTPLRAPNTHRSAALRTAAGASPPPGCRPLPNP